MQRVLNFLEKLHDNNNREWFHAHKQDYLAAQNIFNEFAMEFLKGIRSFDDSIGDLQLKDITYRIYRDTRFSKDKSPYKNHMGVYVCPGGKKSGFGGYYFQISAAREGGWEEGHMLAAGDYRADPKVVRTLREDILNGNGDFRAILNNLDKRFILDTSIALKKVPAGFPADSPDSELFRLKNFLISYSPDTKFITSSGMLDEVLAVFKTAAPFIHYINRAIEFCKEDNYYSW
ncbi:MAG: DUF2461 domain-containing protein [Bacteroidales bacterium]|nr:DUF2461 domain-containing protein [Bacteroidales bacterium]